MARISSSVHSVYHPSRKHSILLCFLPLLKRKRCTEVKDEPHSQFLITDTADFSVHLQAPNTTVNMSAKTNCDFYKINLESVFF